MKILRTVADMRNASRAARGSGKRFGLVPTMGALHEGHLSLVRAARSRCDGVVVSIFVNPTQFGPNEDLGEYPRTFERDCELLRNEGVDFAFAPSVEEMYGGPNVTWVTVEGMSERLCGQSRPGHFRGVTTVVSKLFHIVEPDVAFFGQKDAAQAAIIRRMVRDQNMPAEIVVCPIVREPSGLAMSSRNVYLSAAQKNSARVLYGALREMQGRFESGERDAQKLIAIGKEIVGAEPAAKLVYLEIVDPDTLESLPKIDRAALVAIAAFLGSTRLIDNVVLQT